MLLQDGDLDARTGEQETQHHACGPAADDDAAGALAHRAPSAVAPVYTRRGEQSMSRCGHTGRGSGTSGGASASRWKSRWSRHWPAISR